MATRSMILAGLFAALIAISSQFSLLLPLSPVPHTLQVIFVMLAGVLLGGRWGFTSVAVWVLLGAFGLPVFAQGRAGLIELVGPTGGFKVGFMVCAYCVGWLAERTENSFVKTAGIMFGGLVIVYLLGVLGLMGHFIYFQHKMLTWKVAVSLAVIPFLPYDIIKTLLAAYIGVRVRRALTRNGLVGGR